MENKLEVLDCNNELVETATNEIVKLENQIKELKVKQDNYKVALKEAMEKYSVKKLENDFLTITYVAPTTKETFDTKKFKADHEDTYNEYVKISDVASSVRVKVK